MSGGLDSTYTVLNLYSLKFWLRKPVILLHCDTRNQTKTSLATLEKLKEYITPEWSFTKYKPTFSGDHKRHRKTTSPLFWIIESLKRLDKAKKLLEEGRYTKSVFPCCYRLKHKPFDSWIKKGDFKGSIFVSSIRGGESKQRQLFLARLRKQNTKFYYHKTKELAYYYPLRDINKDTIKNYFKNHAPAQFLNIRHSSCRICPIIALFDLKYEGENYWRTMRVVNRLKAKIKA